MNKRLEDHWKGSVLTEDRKKDRHCTPILVVCLILLVAAIILCSMAPDNSEWEKVGECLSGLAFIGCLAVLVFVACTKRGGKGMNNFLAFAKGTYGALVVVFALVVVLAFCMGKDGKMWIEFASAAMMFFAIQFTYCLWARRKFRNLGGVDSNAYKDLRMYRFYNVLCLVAIALLVVTVSLSHIPWLSWTSPICDGVLLLFRKVLPSFFGIMLFTQPASIACIDDARDETTKPID